MPAWFARVLPDDRYVPSGRDVVARSPLDIFISIEIEVFCDVAFFRREPVASTHGSKQP